MKPNFFDNDEFACVRIHGNGFLQAELEDGYKLHVWAKDCPRQVVGTEIHNHTVGFTSYILLGKLRNAEYTTVPVCAESDVLHADSPVYKEYQAVPRHDKDTGLVDTGNRVRLVPTRMMELDDGSFYEFPAGTFHQTVPQTALVATMVKRWYVDTKPELPTVLVESYQEPDNDFDRYEHQEYAMRLYNKVKYLLCPELLIQS